MNKKWMSTALAATLMGGIGGVWSVTHASTANPSQSVQQQTGKQETESNDAAEQAKLEKAAKISKQDSIKIAAEKVSGTVQGAELEDEDGQPVYNVTVKDKQGTVHEVKVDAITGKVNKVEQADAETGSETDSE